MFRPLTPPYFLGAASAERARLIRQAAIWDPFTERLFREAGIGPGQRVLDIGSGVGDVAMLAAKLVGPSGVVVGVERDRKTIAMARSRVDRGRAVQRELLESDVEERPKPRALRCGGGSGDPAILARGG